MAGRSVTVQGTSGSSPGTFDYYISPTGSNSNNGTSTSTPWSITALNSATHRTLYAGKTVGLMDGTYGLFTIMGLPSSGGVGNTRLTVKGGTSPAPTIIKAVNARAAIIDGERAAIQSASPSLDWHNGLIGPLDDYVTLDGLKFVGGNFSSVTNHGIGDNFTIQNCWFANQSYITGNAQGTNSAHFYTEQVSNMRVSNCKFENGSSPSDSNRHSEIQTYADDDSIIEYCTITTSVSGGNGIHHKGNPGTGTRPGRRHTVRYCFIDSSASGSSGSAIRWHGNENTDGSEKCHNTVFVLGPSIGIYSEGIDNTWDLYNLTLSAASPNAMYFLPDGSPVAINLHDCIWSRTGTGSYGDVRYPSNSLLSNVDYNLWDSNPALKIVSDSNGTYTTLSAFQSATGKGSHDSTTTNPLFTGTGTYAAAYQLQAGSPGKTLGLGGTEVGAWGNGATQIGCDF